MPTFSEITSWTTQEVEVQLRRLLPSGWTVQTACQEGIFLAAVNDDKGRGQWQAERPDWRLLLLDVYGWLLVRQSTGGSPVWSRPKGEPLRPGSLNDPPRGVEDGPATFVQDPEDLDPGEVQAVLATATRKRDG